MPPEVAPGLQLRFASRVGLPNVWRTVFSFPNTLAALLIVVTVLTVRSRFSDPDMWWHLKMGEIIWTTHTIPQADLFSFTASGHAWTPQEWLSQLVIYSVYRLGGYTGLMLWFCTTASLIVVAGYVLCATYSSNAKVAFLGGLIIWLFSTVGLAIRPHMIGYLLLTCELLILHFGRSRNPRWFLALPPLFALWVNSHGSFFFGLIICATVLLSACINIRIGLLVSRRWEKHSRNVLAIAFALSIAALFCNPVGWNQVTYPVDVIANQQVQMHSVSEWLPPRFDNVRALALLAVTALILLVPLLRCVELTIQELLMLGFAFGLAIQHERILFVFGIIATPILCRLLATAWDQYEPDKDRPLVNATLCGIALILLVWSFPRRGQLERQVEANNPVKAVQFITQSRLSGRMLNEYVFGGYLIWAAPQHKVFVDGRGDVFEWTGVLTDYGKLMTLQEDPNLVLDKYDISFCILSREAPMTHVFPLIAGWKVVYSDAQASVFMRTTIDQGRG